MKTFATHIILSHRDAKYIEKLDKHEDFHFDYRDDPSLSNWESKGGDSSTSIRQRPSKEDIKRYKEDQNYYLAKELLIIAKNINIAENIMNLVFGGMVLGHPELNFNTDPVFCYEIQGENVNIDYYLSQSINYRVLLGCCIALNSWDDEFLIYSVEKFRFSIELEYISPHSASPIYGQKFRNFSQKYRSHVNSGYAIFIAYSIIEELKLAIRSSAENPRFLDGNWNPNVKEDIIKRLNDVGIKEDDYISWLRRGEPTKLQEEIEPELGVEYKYNNKLKNVRDLKLKIYL